MCEYEHSSTFDLSFLSAKIFDACVSLATSCSTLIYCSKSLTEQLQEVCLPRQMSTTILNVYMIYGDMVNIYDCRSAMFFLIHVAGPPSPAPEVIVKLH